MSEFINLYGGAMDGSFVRPQAVAERFLVSEIKKRPWKAAGEKLLIWDWCATGGDAKVVYRQEGVDRLVFQDMEMLP